MNPDRQARLHAEARERRQREAQQSDRERLAQNMQKKLMSAAVGALVAVEDEFGKPDEAPIDEDEAEYKAAFQRLRDRVFDAVNALIRGMRSELALHDVTYVGKRVELRPPVNPSPNSFPNQKPDLDY